MDLLDLIATFDCVDHGNLLNHLKNKFGITGVALEWISSFLTDHTQQVFFTKSLSDNPFEVSRLNY